MVELHDCFAHNELISYEALGLCAEGGAAALIAAGDNTYGGKVVTNPSGGLLSKGHPLGATGLAQCYELTQQLRGTAEQRQVPEARIGLQHTWAWAAPASSRCTRRFEPPERPLSRAVDLDCCNAAKIACVVRRRH